MASGRIVTQSSDAVPAVHETALLQSPRFYLEFRLGRYLVSVSSSIVLWRCFGGQKPVGRLRHRLGRRTAPRGASFSSRFDWGAGLSLRGAFRCGPSFLDSKRNPLPALRCEM